MTGGTVGGSIFVAADMTHLIVQTAHRARKVQLATENQVTHAVARSAAPYGQAGPTPVRDVGMSCVPYARNATGIALIGDAWQWWDLAAGAYARGRVPEPGCVLVFRPNERMPLGHVAAIAAVVNNREIEIDHANWAVGGVARGVAVIDVSENDDWTAVRVSVGSATSFGSVYPTYGFIYDRSDSGTTLTAIIVPVAHRTLNPPPRHMWRTAGRVAVTADILNAREYDEVAEASSHPRLGRGDSLMVDRPDPTAP
jgi:surface antigen